MITTISLTSINSHSYNFFLAKSPFKIYSLSNFQIYNTVLLTIATMLYITSLELIYLKARSLYLFDYLHSFPPAPTLHLRQPPICSLFL